MYLLRNDLTGWFLCLKTSIDNHTGKERFSYYWGAINDKYLRIADNPVVFKNIIKKYHGFIENLEMTDGSIYPPRLVRDAAKIGNDHKYKASISVVKIKFEPVNTFKFEGDIQLPIN